jgi:hypothetical protein
LDSAKYAFGDGIVKSFLDGYVVSVVMSDGYGWCSVCERGFLIEDWRVCGWCCPDRICEGKLRDVVLLDAVPVDMYFGKWLPRDGRMYDQMEFGGYEPRLNCDRRGCTHPADRVIRKLLKNGDVDQRVRGQLLCEACYTVMTVT